MKVRTRYAPSPTGYLHIGGARSALFTYLTAKSQGGDFIIRIEDTDIERNVEGGEVSQLDNLAWLGIIPDESPLNPGEYGPYRQSEKLEKYRQAAEKLVAENKAYKCYCSKEELDRDREIAIKNGETPRYSRRCRNLTAEQIAEFEDEGIKPVIRLKINDDDVFSWTDLIRGQISVPGKAMTDPVILKSNGIAMYNFCNVIDDYDMRITHITRGEEHISNTPYQIAIKKALGIFWDFTYAHMSIITNKEGKKLSKRDKTLKQFIEDYRNDGYSPAAICNFIALLGWSPEDNKEIKTIKELEQSFTITRCSKSPAMFDEEKLQFLSSHYIKKMPEDEYLEFIRQFTLPKYSYIEEWFNHLSLAFKKQITYAGQINDLAYELLSENKLTREQERLIENDKSTLVLGTFTELIASINDWTPENIQAIINETKTITGIKGKDLFMPIRLAATRHEHGPELAKVIYLFGFKRVLENLGVDPDEIHSN